MTELKQAYTLELTVDDIRTIRFVGYRYSWSQALIGLEEGPNGLTEPEAWEIREAFEEDDGDCVPSFPMLDPNSKLCAKLFHLWEEIV
jgi:hypothetical protein